MPDYTIDKGEDEDGYRYKTYQFWMLYNWKSGNVKMYTSESRAKKSEGPYDIVEEVTRTIKQPKNQMFKSEGTMEMDEKKVAEITAEEM